MRGFILLLFFEFSALCIYTQTPVIAWQKMYGGTGNEISSCIVETQDKGFILLGGTTSTDGEVTGYKGSGGTTNYGDVWIVKTDSVGNIQWQKTLGGSGDDFAVDIIETPDGGYAFAGQTYSSDYDVKSGNNGGQEMWLVKLDNMGNIIWEKTWGGSGYEEAMAIQNTTDGGFIAIGSSTSNDYDMAGLLKGMRDAVVIKLDQMGNIQWFKNYGGSDTEAGVDISITNDGGYIFVANTLSSDIDITTPNYTSTGWLDIWVVKIDSQGNIEWSRTLGGKYAETSKAVLQTADGNFLIYGNAVSTDGDVQGSHSSIGQTSNLGDWWLVKLSASGTNIIWQRCIGGSSTEWGYYKSSFKITCEGSYLMSGNSGSGINGDKSQPNQPSSNNHVWVAEIDSAAPRTKKFDITLKSTYGGFQYNMNASYGHIYPCDDGLVLLTEANQAGYGGYWLTKYNYKRSCFLTDSTKTSPNDVIIPSAFTPNGDGVNDVFLPIVNDVKEFEMKIYNRWGNLIFQSLNASIGWDGQNVVNNLIDQATVFIYCIKFMDSQNQYHQSMGHICLVR